MIIGNGDIASVLPDRNNLLFFASGVSNSRETRQSEYRREINLLMKQDDKAHIVYFSSLAIFYTDTKYTRHKKFMENLIKAAFEHYTIVRLGNITWGNNPNTFLNFLKNKIKNNEPYEIQAGYRFMVEKDEFLYWMNIIPEWNCELNITGRRMPVVQALKEYGNL